MKIRLVTPPIEKQVGGIENALDGLRLALRQQKIEFEDTGDAQDSSSIHHFHGLWEPSHAWLSHKLRQRNLPYIVSPHGMLEPWAFHHLRWKKLPYYRLIEQRHLTGARALLVASKKEAQNLAKVLIHPYVKVLPIGCSDAQGVNFDSSRRQSGWTRRERVILFLSRLDVKKGLDLLLLAMTDDRFDWNSWRLVVVGDGTTQYVNTLKQFAADHAARLPAIDWVGAVWGEQRWPYLQAADLYCLPTHSENFGISVLEAMHAGTPVLTTSETPWGQFREMDGLFISNPDAGSLTLTLTEARRRLEDTWTTKDREARSKWASENFDWDNLAPLYKRMYQSVQLE
mgnify:FL=1